MFIKTAKGTPHKINVEENRRGAVTIEPYLPTFPPLNQPAKKKELPRTVKEAETKELNTQLREMIMVQVMLRKKFLLEKFLLPLLLKVAFLLQHKQILMNLHLQQ